MIEAVKTTAESKSDRSFHEQLLDAIPKAGTEKAARLSAVRLFKYAQGNAVQPDAIKKELDEDIATFKKEINKYFKKNGIDTSQSINLECDAEGYLRVTNDHPDKEKIEEIFAGDFDLRNLCVKINGFTEMLETMPETTAFQKAYAANPRLAVAQFSYLFGGNNIDRFYTSLRPQNGSWTVNIIPTEPYMLRYKPHSSEDFVAQEHTKDNKYVFAAYF